MRKRARVRASVTYDKQSHVKRNAWRSRRKTFG